MDEHLELEKRMHALTAGQWEVGHSDDAPGWVATVWANGHVVASLCHPSGRKARPEALAALHANAELISLSAEYHAALVGMAEVTDSDLHSFKRTQLLASELVAVAIRCNADMHTPGPWFVSESPQPSFRLDVCSKTELIATCTQQHNLLGEVEANASVMAKAPDMFAALKRIVQLDVKSPAVAAAEMRAIATETVGSGSEPQQSMPPQRRGWQSFDQVRGKPRRSGRGRIARTAEPSLIVAP